MGLVLCEIRILDGTETLTWYAIWNNTTDCVEKEHPLFDTRETGELYMKIWFKNEHIQIQLNATHHDITMEILQEWMVKELTEGGN